MLLEVVLMLTVQASNAETDFGDKQNLLCKNGKIVRTLAFVVDKEKKECSTLYTKGGIERQIGNGKNFSTCREVFNQVKGTLEKADWKCKDISTLQILGD